MLACESGEHPRPAWHPVCACVCVCVFVCVFVCVACVACVACTAASARPHDAGLDVYEH